MRSQGRAAPLALAASVRALWIAAAFALALWPVAGAAQSPTAPTFPTEITGRITIRAMARERAGLHCEPRTVPEKPTIPVEIDCYEDNINYQATARVKLKLDDVISDADHIYYEDVEPAVTSQLSGSGKIWYAQFVIDSWTNVEPQPLDVGRVFLSVTREGRGWRYHLSGIPFRPVVHPSGSRNKPDGGFNFYRGKSDEQRGFYEFDEKLSGPFNPKSPPFGGSATFQNSSEGTTEETTITWSFGGQEELEAIMWTDEYDEWLPEAGSSEDVTGTLLRINVKLQVKGKPQAEVHEKALFRFELHDVSTEPGVAMNWPPQGEQGVKGTPDLAIEDVRNPTLEVTAAWQTQGGHAGSTARTKARGTKAEVLISSFDWGAWATLRVTAELESGETVFAHLRGKEGTTALRVPKDENDNHIGDPWERRMHAEGVAAEADDDEQPTGAGPGDGLSAYEEYRGVLTDGDHVRTDPHRKDLFIHSDVPGAEEGLDLFRAASGIAVHEITEEEYGSNTVRVVNINHKTANLVPQHGLWLTTGRLDDKTAGRSPIGPPKNVDKVEIKQDYWQRAGPADYAGTIAHELGHAVAIQHHGDGDYYVVASDDPAKEEFVAVQHGEHSGVEPCIMRYESADWIDRGGGKLDAYGAREYRGPLFCRLKAGTGVNAPSRKPWPKAGDAARGACRKQIRVSDR